MNFSQNYFKKTIEGQSKKHYFDTITITERILKRYGDYCRLEERTENARVVNANKAFEEGLDELKKMAKEDGLM